MGLDIVRSDSGLGHKIPRRKCDQPHDDTASIVVRCSVEGRLHSNTAGWVAIVRENDYWVGLRRGQ